MIERLKSFYRPTVASIFDQAMQSGANFLAVVGVSRAYPQAEVGELILALSVLQIALALQRSIVTLPFIVTQSHEAHEQTAGGWFAVNVAVVLAFAPFLAIASVMLQSGVLGVHVSSSMAWALCCLVPSLCCYEFCRRWMYQIGRYPRANVMAVLLGVGYLGGTAVAVTSPSSLSATLWGYALGAALGAAVTVWFGLGQIRGVRHAFAEWRGMWGSIGWHLASTCAHTSYTSGLPLLIGAVARNAEAIAVFGVTRALVTPVLSAATAIDSVEKPAASRAFQTGGEPAMRLSLRRTRRILLLLASPVLVLLVAFGPWVLEFAYGAAYREHYPVLLLWVGFVTLTLLTQPVETGAIIRKLTRVLFTSKVAGCLAGLIAVMLLTPKWGALGATAAAVIAVAVNLQLVRCLLRSHSNAWTAPSSVCG